MSLQVAIDGPAGAGKSTVAQRVAEATGLTLVDTGAIYRALALASAKAGLDEEDEAANAALAKRLRIDFVMRGGQNRIVVDGVDVSDDIRTAENSMRASTISRHPLVRAALLQLQRTLGESDAVLEGRDIGTVVFPEAKVKIFLTATAEERAKRRTKELKKRGKPQVFAAVLKDIEVRDKQDRERATAPLIPADDAIILDSTSLNIDEVVAKIVGLIDTLR